MASPQWRWANGYGLQQVHLVVGAARCTGLVKRPRPYLLRVMHDSGQLLAGKMYAHTHGF